jgi:preprotein translocase subunit SecY
MYGGQNSTLPIKLNMSGVMPIIFASSIISLPATIMTLVGVESAASMDEGTAGFWNKFYDFMASDGWFYPLIYVVLIVLFSYFYITISFNPVEVANNLKKNGGMIPGIRQGRPTSDYIRKILNKVTLIGAIFLAIIAVLPLIASPLIVTPIVTKLLSNVVGGSSISASSLASTFSFGGTSLLIVIGVAQETYRELEAQLTMRNYKGFL